VRSNFERPWTRPNHTTFTETPTIIIINNGLLASYYLLPSLVVGLVLLWLLVRQRECPGKFRHRRRICVQWTAMRGILRSTDRPRRSQCGLSSLQIVGHLPAATDCWFDPRTYGSFAIYQPPQVVVLILRSSSASVGVVRSVYAHPMLTSVT